MDLKKLNSLTKYPSILTYHRLGERGRLTETLTDENGYLHDSEFVYLYEKVDGENARIIFFKNDKGEPDYLIGSREELLYAKGDRIGNPYGNIADFLKPIAEKTLDNIFSDKDWALTVIYQESYGGKTKAAKNYTDSKAQHYRFFDVFSIDKAELDHLLSLPQERIAEWREHGHQPFYHEEGKTRFAKRLGLDSAPLLAEKLGLRLPRTIADIYTFLKQFEHTQVGIDASGRSEGIIARSADRKQIRKIRFEDYERTLKK
ncbi:RNA ligase family protein [Paenibacillus sinopodophylli]|uniref:RNA ligase family protein n=1 Tax=Paenibacillus sinopodophylli TaxID=1837342 RepID=UPI00110C9C79|nr:RNA ligase family protein [Paenibacillus sinopodophylli]